MKILSIDASINEIGIAAIQSGNIILHHTFRTDPSFPVEKKLKQIAGFFSEIKKRYDYDVAVIELPDKFVRFGRGMMNFASLQLLHLAIGAIVGGLSGHGTIIEFMRVSAWRRGKTKKFTQSLARTLTNEKRLNTHESDAILMGLRWEKEDKLKRAGIPNAKQSVNGSQASV